jgi:hypothetical protein
LDRFCLTAGIEALGTMMEQDAEQACGARHARSDGRRVRSPLGRLQCEQASCGSCRQDSNGAFVAQMKGQMVAVDQAANIGIQF